jgi:hypothetical protein
MSVLDLDIINNSPENETRKFNDSLYDPNRRCLNHDHVSAGKIVQHILSVERAKATQAYPEEHEGHDDRAL